MKTWLLQKTSTLLLSSIQEKEEARVVEEMLDLEVVHAKRQRLANCKVRQTEQECVPGWMGCWTVCGS